MRCGIAPRQSAYGVFAQPALNRSFWDKVMEYMAWHGAASQVDGGNFYVNIGNRMRAPLSVPAALVVRSS